MYESKIYIVAPTEQYSRDAGKCFAEIIAVFNLGSVHTLIDINERYGPTNYYVYADDGDTRVMYDMYGEELRELTVDQLILELSIHMTVTFNNRVSVLLSTLRDIRELYDDNTILCLHYGY